MAEIKMGTVWKVEIIESERGWGSKIDEVKYFDNKEEAEQYVRQFNAKNTANVAPDWYMRADGPYKVS